MSEKILTRPALATFVMLLLFFLLTYAWKASELLWIAGVSSHLSNFALTGAGILALVGPRHFTKKSSQPRLLIVIALFTVANIFVEAFGAGTLGGFNVVDGYDAVFGISACAVVWIAHLFVRQPE